MSESEVNKRQTIGWLTKSLVEAQRSSLSWEFMTELAEEKDINLLTVVGRMLKSPIGYEAQANILYDLVNPSNVDGLVVTGGIGHYVDEEELQRFCQCFNSLPQVSLEVLLNGIPSIITDFYSGICALMQHLVKNHGRRRIAFIRGPSDSKTGEDRYRAYLDSLARWGLPVDFDLVAQGTFFAPSGADAVRLLVDERKVPFDALVAANDEMAIDALQALQARGIRVPDEVAVTGFDNLEIARSIIPPLTTVELPAHQVVRLATEIVLASLRGEEVPARTDIHAEVIVRQSCGCQSAAMVMAEAPSGGQEMPPTLVGKASDWLSILAEQRPRILEAMVTASGPSTVWDDPSVLDDLWEAFVHDLREDGEGGFCPTLERLIHLPFAAGIEPSCWQGVLSAHRRHVRPLLGDSAIALRAENLWQRGRVLLAEAALNLEAQQQVLRNQLDATLQSVGESLITTFDVTGLMASVVRELPRLHIPAVYIALYEDNEPISGYSRLVLAYNENGRLPIEPEGLLFHTREILPAEVLPKGRRHSHVVFPLSFHEERLGLVVYEVGPRNGVIYETLSLQLSSALKGALLVDEALQAKQTALQAKALAERADKIKTRLLANVTHELRTPLNVISGYSHMTLLDPNPYHVDLPASLRNDLGHIQSSAQHLSRLINDLLDLSRAEIGELDLFPEPVAPRALLEQAFHAIADSVGATPALQWRLDLPQRLPTIQGDPTRLRQIVLNLLSNASKFTEAGEIVLGAEVTPPHLHLWVRDTGYGIPVDRQEHIFEPFFTEGYSNQRPNGIGLGLTITRQLVALHGGSLSLESQPDQGSTFHVYLPLPNLSGRMLPLPLSETGHRRPILLFISSMDAPSDEVAVLTKRANWEVRRVSSLSDLRAALTEAHPAALAWDLTHARPGDWAIIQQIRSHPHLCQIPFMLFRESTVEKTTSTTTMTSLLLKPMSSQTLTDLIESLQPTSIGGTILIVDDDPQAREVYFRFISERFPGFPVAIVEDGSIALDWLERETPGLVLLDLSMPMVDGFAVLEHLRANPRTRAVPVFVLTGRLLSYEDVQRLDYSQVILQFKQVMSDEETVANLQRAFAGTGMMPQPTSHLVKKALAYVQHNYARTLSRPEIAAAVGVSEDYLSRIFTNETGLSPWVYLNRYRVQQAKRLLRESDRSITWIAAQVGFEDPAYFSRVFRSIEGCSPRAYRTP